MMKIKLAILDPSKKQLNRIAAALASKHDDMLEIYSFSDPEIALQNIRKNRIRVFLANECFTIDTANLEQCGFAYLSESKGSSNSNGDRTVCIFDKIEDIYKQILEIFMHAGGSLNSHSDHDGSSRVIAFCSAGGGVGASSLAAACAIRCASLHKRVLYLNLESLGDPAAFFEGEGENNLSDVFYTLKGKKNALNMKLTTTVRHDPNGVFFYAATRSARDLLELEQEELQELLNELKRRCGYDYIILDMDFGLDESAVLLYQNSDVVVMVSDGTEISNRKTERACQALEETEQKMDLFLLDRLCLLYNRGSSRTSKDAQLPDIRVLGKYPMIANATNKQVVQTLAQSGIFEQIL